MARSTVRSIKRVITEGSVLLLDTIHRNASDILAAPASLTYRIDDLTNDREILDWTTVAAPASENTITITGAQNTLQDRNKEFEVRQITTRALDASSNPDIKDFRYKIDRIFDETGQLP